MRVPTREVFGHSAILYALEVNVCIFTACLIVHQARLCCVCNYSNECRRYDR